MTGMPLTLGPTEPRPRLAGAAGRYRRIDTSSVVTVRVPPAVCPRAFRTIQAEGHGTQSGTKTESCLDVGGGRDVGNINWITFGR